MNESIEKNKGYLDEKHDAICERNMRLDLNFDH